MYQSMLTIQEIIAERASGSEVWDTDGKRYLDFTSGIGVTSTGHSHPKIVKAIQEQASKLLFAQQNILPVTPATVNLVDHLRRIVPDTLTRFFFCNSGSEAVDNAMKLARAHTGRQNIITFQVSMSIFYYTQCTHPFFSNWNSVMPVDNKSVSLK